MTLWYASHGKSAARELNRAEDARFHRSTSVIGLSHRRLHSFEALGALGFVGCVSAVRSKTVAGRHQVRALPRIKAEARSARRPSI